MTSFAPGFEATSWFFDPADRAHVALDGLVFVNTGRGGRKVDGGLLREVGAKERFDLALGARAAVPRLRVAEVGFNVHTLTDTADRWRMSAIDSYVYSILLNRPEVDYFRRTGLTAFVTTRPTEALTLGAEYRIDRYDTMRSLDDVFTIFNRDESPWASRSIDDGAMGSVLLRLEWAAGRGPKDRLGDIARRPESSVWTSKAREARYRPFATVNTVEIARPGLGGDARFRFVRLVSDSAVFLPTGRRHGVRLRGRAAGKLSGGLPAQKAEELGGWSALRGHRNKELGPGDFSYLGTVELVHRGWDLSAFADLGAVHLPAAPGRAARWQGPRLGFGASLDFGADSALVFAWRTDDDARFRPRLRLLFQRTF